MQDTDRSLALHTKDMVLEDSSFIVEIKQRVQPCSSGDGGNTVSNQLTATAGCNTKVQAKCIIIYPYHA